MFGESKSKLADFMKTKGMALKMAGFVKNAPASSQGGRNIPMNSRAAREIMGLTGY